MSTKQQEKQNVQQEKQDRQQRTVLIGKVLLQTLGQPVDLHRVHVRHLWDDHYRVNIFVGADAASARIAHSFFLVADSSGNIVESNPGITKVY
jgi:hypothetical protein